MQGIPKKKVTVRSTVQFYCINYLLYSNEMNGQMPKQSSTIKEKRTHLKYVCRMVFLWILSHRQRQFFSLFFLSLFTIYRMNG